MDILINGVRYIPAEAQPDEVRFYYMHDNHTFSRLPGTTLDEILENADARAEESCCGMLCAPTLFAGGKEVRRLKSVAHAPCCGRGAANWIAGKEAWKKECAADTSVLRLLATAEENQGADL